MNKYVGDWIDLSNLNRDIVVGDLVMVDTFGDTLVVEVSEIKDDELWHCNGWIIPKHQIVAIKRDEI